MTLKAVLLRNYNLCLNLKKVDKGEDTPLETESVTSRYP